MNSEIFIEIENQTLSNSTIDSPSVFISIEGQIIFYIYLFLDIPSVLCSLFLFYCFFRPLEPSLPAQSNQMIMYLLLGAFLLTAIDVPLMLPYYHNHYYIESMKDPNTFCIFWMIFEYALYSINLWLMTFFSLERYLLIFFKQSVMRTKKRRFFLYYGLVSVVVVFILVWYVYLVALYSCEQSQFDYTQIVCGIACYQVVANDMLLNSDWIICILLPMFLTIFFTLILILHVFYQKHKISRHVRHRETWKRTRKIFLKLLPVTLIFLCFSVPLVVVGLLSVSDPWYNTTPYYYTNALCYGTPLLTPFAIVSKDKVMRRRLLRLITLKQFNQTTPIINNTLPMRLMHTQTIRKMMNESIRT